MTQNYLALITILSPLAFAVTAIASRLQAGKRPNTVKKLATASTLISMLVSLVSVFLTIKYNFLETPFIGAFDLGLTLRLDSLSIIMLTMIALLGFIVVRFSLNYLDGDDRQGAFIGRLAATIASVQLLVLSGNLGILFISWVLTSMSLHKLLVFYKERPGAIIAARKKFIVARLGDTALLIAFVLLYFQFNTGNLEMIFSALKDNLVTGNATNGIEAVAILLALSAMLKSAQFPTHGWLIEVMETPTPVSALLHAGLLNAGPFLIVRMAYVMEASTYAPILLITLGGFTALFASVIFLTQTSIKTALAYSSVAHMGFSLMVCGLGVYPAAMLHLVAHSFYKAHAFLSSGSVIDSIRSAKIKSTQRIGSPARITLGIIIGMVIYSGFAFLWGIDPVNEFSLLAIGAIIVMGLSRIITSAIDSNGSIKLMIRAGMLSVIVTTAFFVLESGAHSLLSTQLPEIAIPSMTEMILIGFITMIFGAVVFMQIAAPTFSSNAVYQEWAIHLRNGLYVNTVFDRTVRALYSRDTSTKPVLVENVQHLRKTEPLQFVQLQHQTT